MVKISKRLFSTVYYLPEDEEDKDADIINISFQARSVNVTNHTYYSPVQLFCWFCKYAGFQVRNVGQTRALGLWGGGVIWVLCHVEFVCLCMLSFHRSIFSLSANHWC